MLDTSFGKPLNEDGKPGEIRFNLSSPEAHSENRDGWNDGVPKTVGTPQMG